ncbi:hypothetical protein Glove_543g7 [Diversispora epigaea]|uniref:Uncharacterized protein n=1 Tax=Diversispora epigaea TaxID=1348612 RepID=A0A397GL68_9GLOM|nr:hypothetical protein Glove_543g7 [Diversispora epigaea]
MSRLMVCGANNPTQHVSKNDFDKWKSGNETIDEFIQDFQLNIKSSSSNNNRLLRILALKGDDEVDDEVDNDYGDDNQAESSMKS